MRCDRCGREAILFQRYSGLRLCGDHAAASLEARAKRMIRAGGWIRPGDRIAIGLSGSPGSCSLLRFLSVTFGMRRDLSLVAITVDDGHGTGPGRDMDRIRGISESLGVEWAMTGIPVDFRDPLPGAVPEEAAGHRPARHARPRDRALSSLAGDLGARRLALGTSLEDVAGAFFLRVIRGGGGRFRGDEEEGEGGIPRIRPFSRVPEEELALYARLNGIDSLPGNDRGSPDPLGAEAARMIREYTRRHPSALFSLAHMAEALAVLERSRGGGPVPSGGRNGDGSRVTGHV